MPYAKRRMQNEVVVMTRIPAEQRRLLKILALVMDRPMNVLIATALDNFIHDNRDVLAAAVNREPEIIGGAVRPVSAGQPIRRSL